jgi:thiol-disulfide isomerase/thioredoxin
MQCEGTQPKRVRRLDRLPALIAALVALASPGCEDEGAGGKSGSGSGSRVVAVNADPVDPKDLEGFCDVRPEPQSAPALNLPPTEGSPASGKQAQWRWVNVWATWCKPCVEEIPRLAQWEKRLRDDGIPFDLVLVSVDEKAEAVQEYREAHAEIPETLRLSNKDDLKGWLEHLGMDAGATIPLQVIADPEDRVRCVRSGAVDRPHYRTVKTLLEG